MDWRVAGALAVCAGATFLLSLVLNWKPSEELTLGRNDPQVVWYRVRALLGFTTVSVGLMVAWLSADSGALQLVAQSLPGGSGGVDGSPFLLALEATRLMPKWDVAGVVCGVLVVLVLFAGHVVDGVWAGVEAFAGGLAPGMDAFAGDGDVSDVTSDVVPARGGRGGGCGLVRCVLAELSQFDDALLCPPPHDRERQLVMLRDLVAAPVLEEVLFRSCMGALVLASGATIHAANWLTPLAFAGAHFHLGVRSLVQGEPLVRVLGVTAVRTAYTFAFGVIAMHLWSGTRSLAAPVMAHLLCNWFGLPDVRRVAGHLWAALSCDGTARARAAVPRAAVVITMYAAGVIGFFAAVPELTAWAASASSPDLVSSSA